MQNLRKSTCWGVCYLKRKFQVDVFLWTLWNFSKHAFCRKHLATAFAFQKILLYSYIGIKKGEQMVMSEYCFILHKLVTWDLHRRLKQIISWDTNRQFFIIERYNHFLKRLFYHQNLIFLVFVIWVLLFYCSFLSYPLHQIVYHLVINTPKLFFAKQKYRINIVLKPLSLKSILIGFLRKVRFKNLLHVKVCFRLTY